MRRGRTAGVAAVLACAVAAPAAAPGPTTLAYDVTVDVSLSEDWRYLQHADRECVVGRCVTDEAAEGRRRLKLRTKRPVRVEVIRIKGRRPMFSGSTGGMLPLVGSDLQEGYLTYAYSGSPEYDAANPDTAEPMAGCGVRTERLDLALGWTARNTLQPVMALPDVRDCPIGATHSSIVWERGETPDLALALGRVAESKVGRSKQFTVGGSKTFRGLVPAINRQDPGDIFTRNGLHEATWRWDATFRKVKPAKARRRPARRGR